MRAACVIVPALNAEATIGAVIEDVRRSVDLPILVIDDGSEDATGPVATAHGAIVTRHARNLGKGAAIRTGLQEAAKAGWNVAVTVDADGQHPGASVATLAHASVQLESLVLGVRSLARDGAPASNQFGNRVSNFYLSAFSGRQLLDTQCGLRRYPVRETLALNTKANGFAFEGEVILRAVAARLPIVEVPVSVLYPSGARVRSHFRKVVDPTRIVLTVVRTVLELRLGRRGPPLLALLLLAIAALAAVASVRG